MMNFFLIKKKKITPTSTHLLLILVGHSAFLLIVVTSINGVIWTPDPFVPAKPVRARPVAVRLQLNNCPQTSSNWGQKNLNVITMQIVNIFSDILEVTQSM